MVPRRLKQIFPDLVARFDIVGDEISMKCIGVIDLLAFKKGKDDL